MGMAFPTIVYHLIFKCISILMVKHTKPWGKAHSIDNKMDTYSLKEVRNIFLYLTKHNFWMVNVFCMIRAWLKGN